MMMILKITSFVFFVKSSLVVCLGIGRWLFILICCQVALITIIHNIFFTFMAFLTKRVGNNTLFCWSINDSHLICQKMFTNAPVTAGCATNHPSGALKISLNLSFSSTLLLFYTAYILYCFLLVPFPDVLAGFSSVPKTNFPTSAIKCVLISNCTVLRLCVGTPPSG